MDPISSLPAGFDPGSRVWIYQGRRPFTVAEAAESQLLLDSFVADWQSHGTPVKGYGRIFYNQFIVLIADETASGVSGCSTDSSVRLIRGIEQQTGVRLFDRLDLAFYLNEQVRLIPIAQLPAALNSGEIDPDTLYFNNTVQTKQELESKWLIPLKDSWLGSRYLNRTASADAAVSK
ncbi:MAG TPA: hypothetical protein VFE32_19440 [Puia sp.]|jgi:hypothetical protein|nr:hypothetical protein [Puia sp.]